MGLASGYTGGHQVLGRVRNQQLLERHLAPDRRVEADAVIRPVDSPGQSKPPG